MVPAAHRLKGDRHFKRLVTSGRSFFSKDISLRRVPNSLDVSRFAFVVSTKVSKKTVERNKLKRRMREIIRKMIPIIKPGSDILIIGKKSALELNFGQLETAINEVLSKANLIKK